MIDLFRRWLKLLFGFLTIVTFIVVLHWVTNHLAGDAGRMMRRNMNSDLDVGAYIYSDVVDIDVFLDDDEGKYGKTAVMGSLVEHHQQKFEYRTTSDDQF